MLDMGVVPRLSDVYGIPGTLSMLQEVLRKYSVHDWLCTLSRLTILLCGTRSRELAGEHGSAFLHRFLPPPLAIWYEQQIRKGRMVSLFTERHVGSLIELAILNCREDSPTGEVLADVTEETSRALLILTELEGMHCAEVDSPATKAAALRAAVPTLLFRSNMPHPREAMVRGFNMFEILSPNRSHEAQHVHDLFEEAFGLSLDHYFIGGACLLVMALSETPDSIAAGWTPLPSQAASQREAMLVKCLNAYYGVASAPLAVIREAIGEFEAVDAVGSFNLIALSKYPVVHSTDGVRRPLYLAGIADSLCDGIYQRLHDAATKKKIRASAQNIALHYGKLFERYLLDVLAVPFGDRLLRNPKRSDNGNEAADGIVVYGDRLVLFEAKGYHWPITRKFGFKGPEDIACLLARAGVEKAVESIAKSVSCVRKGLIPSAVVGDPGTTVIQPVAVTHEPAPLVGIDLPYLDKHLDSLPTDDFTRRIVMMTPRSIECVAGLAATESLWDVLTEYLTAAEWKNRSFDNFLNHTNRACPTTMDTMFSNMHDIMFDYLQRQPE